MADCLPVGQGGGGCSRLWIAVQRLFRIRKETPSQRAGGGALQGHVCWSSLGCSLGKENQTRIPDQKQNSEHHPQQTHPGPNGPDCAWAGQKACLRHTPPPPDVPSDPARCRPPSRQINV